MFNLENFVADLYVENVSHLNIIVYFFLVSPNCNLAYTLPFSQPITTRQRLLKFRLHQLFLFPKIFFASFANVVGVSPQIFFFIII